jgi:hypothetical protein
MNVFWVASVTPTGTIAPEQEKAFREATVIFVGAVLSGIGDKLVDAYLHVRVAKDQISVCPCQAHVLLLD